MFVRKFVHMFVGVFVVRMIFETATFCDLDAAVAKSLLRGSDSHALSSAGLRGPAPLRRSAAYRQDAFATVSGVHNRSFRGTRRRRLRCVETWRA